MPPGPRSDGSRKGRSLEGRDTRFPTPSPSSVPAAEPSWKPEGQGPRVAFRAYQAPGVQGMGNEWAWRASLIPRLTVGFLIHQEGLPGSSLHLGHLTLKPAFRYDLNQIPYDYTVEVRNRFKALDLIDRVPDELWTEVCDI